MKIIKKILYIDFLVFVFFLISLILLPKAKLYYKFEQELKKNNIVISNETIVEHNFGLQIFDATVYTQGIKSFNFKQLDIDFRFYSAKIDIKSITPAKALESMIPKILFVSISYNIFNPDKIVISSLSTQWSLKGEVDLLKRIIHITLIPKKSFRYNEVLNMFKKTKKGNYKYEQKF